MFALILIVAFLDHEEKETPRKIAERLVYYDLKKKQRQLAEWSNTFQTTTPSMPNKILELIVPGGVFL